MALIDQLFAARGQFASFGGAAGVLNPTASALLASLNSSTSTNSDDSSLRVSTLNRQAGELNRNIDRIAGAASALGAAITSANSILSRLTTALSLANDIAVGSASTAIPVSATGTPLTSDPASLLGSVSLVDDAVASGQGNLVLNPVSTTGLVQLADDAAVSLTGDQDVENSNNLLFDTAILQGQTLTIDTGSGTNTITFGIFGGQVNSGTELEQAIDAIAGVESSFNGDGFLRIDGADAETSVVIGGTANTESAFGIARQTHNPTDLLSQGANAGETLTFRVNSGSTQTITFGRDAGEISTLSELSTALSGLSGLTASLTGNNELTFSAATNADAISVGGTVDGASVFGLSQTTYDPANLLLQGINQGETLTFQLGTGAVQNITFGTGSGEVSTISELNTALGGLSGIAASINGSNQLIFSATDARDDIIVGGTADVAGTLGVTKQTYGAFNLLDQGVAAGETLTVQAGSGSIETITFGTGAGEIATLNEFGTALGNLTNVSASLDAQNKVSISGPSGNDTITVGGTVDAQSAFGLAEQTHEPPGLLSQGVAQGETLTFQVDDGAVQSIIFGTGVGEVNTIAELNSALQGLTDISASIDDSNRVTFTSDIATAEITVGGTADIDAAFGIAEQTFAPSAAESSEVSNVLSLLAGVSDDIAGAHVTGQSNLINGRSQIAKFSTKAGDETQVGGFALSIEDLNVVLDGNQAFISEDDKDNTIAALEAAISTVATSIDRLETQSAQIEARSEFLTGLTGVVGDASSKATEKRLTPDEALQAAIIVRKQIGQAVIQSGLTGGAAAKLGDPREPVFNQLVQSAFSNPGSEFFAPPQFLASSAFQA